MSSEVISKGLPLLMRSVDNPYAGTGRWLLGTAGLVVGMIHVGGMTRLTQSGLSMTSWSPLGKLPPLNRAEWEAEFDRYKQFPEWQQRKSMTLSEFQFIYGWEYGHRMFGRLIGVSFGLPWIYFTWKGKIPPGYQSRMAGLLFLGGSQGLIGWWMVKSGLGDDRKNDTKQIKVKPLRLTTHLGMAMATYGVLVWTALDLFSIPNLSQKQALVQQIQLLGNGVSRHLYRLRQGSMAITGLTFITILSGALVAGNDAGRAYNSWPKMGDEWIPTQMFHLIPWERNVFENTATVQFNHRILGTVTALSSISLASLGLHFSRPDIITPQVRRGFYAIAIVSGAQFGLGVTTLLYYVPISLAAIHQLGSVVVFTSGLYLTHSLRYASAGLLFRNIASSKVASAIAKSQK